MRPPCRSVSRRHPRTTGSHAAADEERAPRRPRTRRSPRTRSTRRPQRRSRSRYRPNTGEVSWPPDRPAVTGRRITCPGRCPALPFAGQMAAPCGGRDASSSGRRGRQARSMVPSSAASRMSRASWRDFGVASAPLTAARRTCRCGVSPSKGEIAPARTDRIRDPQPGRSQQLKQRTPLGRDLMRERTSSHSESWQRAREDSNL
jgi:hypothetical protein